MQVQVQNLQAQARKAHDTEAANFVATIEPEVAEKIAREVEDKCAKASELLAKATIAVEKAMAAVETRNKAVLEATNAGPAMEMATDEAWQSSEKRRRLTDDETPESQPPFKRLQFNGSAGIRAASGEDAGGWDGDTGHSPLPAATLTPMITTPREFCGQVDWRKAENYPMRFWRAVVNPRCQLCLSVPLSWEDDFTFDVHSAASKIIWDKREPAVFKQRKWSRGGTLKAACGSEDAFKEVVRLLRRKALNDKEEKMQRTIVFELRRAPGLSPAIDCVTCFPPGDGIDDSYLDCCLESRDEWKETERKRAEIKAKMKRRVTKSSGQKKRDGQEPNFLEVKAQTHAAWQLGAFAELIHNATDAGAGSIHVRHHTINGRDVIEIEDDGNGMNHRTMDAELFGVGKDHAQDDGISMYGEGFKTGTMRIGATVVVITKQSNCNRSISVGIMSNAPRFGDTSRKPVWAMVTFDHDWNLLTDLPGNNVAREHTVRRAMETWSFVPQFREWRDWAPAGSSGTRMFIHDLNKTEFSERLNSKLVYEPELRECVLAQEAERGTDLILCDSDGNVMKTGGRSRAGCAATIVPMDCSLRSFCEIMFLDPTKAPDIFIGGKPVQKRDLQAELQQRRSCTLDVEPLDCRKEHLRCARGPCLQGFRAEPTKAVIGKIPQYQKLELGGAMVYCKNTLILSFDKESVFQGGAQGKAYYHGTICICEVHKYHEQEHPHGFKPHNNKVSFQPLKYPQRVLHAIGNAMKSYDLDVEKTKYTSQRPRQPRHHSASGQGSSGQVATEQVGANSWDDWIQCDDCKAWRLVPRECYLKCNESGDVWRCWNHPYFEGAPEDACGVPQTEREKELGGEPSTNWRDGQMTPWESISIIANGASATSTAASVATPPKAATMRTQNSIRTRRDKFTQDFLSFAEREGL